MTLNDFLQQYIDSVENGADTIADSIRDNDELAAQFLLVTFLDLERMYVERLEALTEYFAKHPVDVAL